MSEQADLIDGALYWLGDPSRPADDKWLAGFYCAKGGGRWFVTGNDQPVPHGPHVIVGPCIGKEPYPLYIVNESGTFDAEAWNRLMPGSVYPATSPAPAPAPSAAAPPAEAAPRRGS